MTRRFASRDEGRTEVLMLAATAIAEHGYHGMTMRHLAKATGRGLASFYHLFSSKDEILFELQQRAFQHLIESATVALRAPGNPVARLHRFISNHVHYFVEQPDVMRVLVQEAATLPPARRAIIRDLKQRYFAIGESLLAWVAPPDGTSPASLERGLHQVDGPQVGPSQIEIERKAYCMFGMLNWIFGWYTPQRHGTPDDVARTILELTVSGVSSMPRAHDLEAINLQLVRTSLLGEAS